MEYNAGILEKKFLTHNTISLVTEKPEGLKFEPGQATELSIDLPDFRDKKRPFTFASLNDLDTLEFVIKIYPDRNGVTKKLPELEKGDKFIIGEPWGSIRYKGPGIFIAGGAGITPFIAILRDLKRKNNLKDNTLIFSNKTEKDIILKKELDSMQELEKIYTLTREDNPLYLSRRIDESFLKERIKNFNQNFYICGPIRMVGEIQAVLQKLGAEADSIVVET